jgi:hypothetical protein
MLGHLEVFVSDLLQFLGRRDVRGDPIKKNSACHGVEQNKHKLKAKKNNRKI